MRKEYTYQIRMQRLNVWRWEVRDAENPEFSRSGEIFGPRGSAVAAALGCIAQLQRMDKIRGFGRRTRNF